MAQVYVHFHPILVDVPENVANALVDGHRDKETAELVCASAAVGELSKVKPIHAVPMAVAMLDKVVKA